MKIECLIKRQGGTTIKMDAPTRNYLFAPETGIHTDPHVAEVEETGHVRALLRVKEGFRVVEGDIPEDELEQFTQEQELVSSTTHAASYPIKGGERITLPDLTAMAFQDSGLEYDEWNSATDEERYGYIDATLRELQDGMAAEDAATPPAQEGKAEDAAPVQEDKAEDAGKKQSSEDVPLNQMQRKDLVEIYKKRFGRQPSTRMSVEDIANALSEED